VHKIYVVEDDENIRGMMLYALQAAGFQGEGFSDGESFFAALREKQPTLLLLDIMLPGEDGLQILQKLRSQKTTSSLPVIMLTAKGAEYERIQGLELGADDYITKPFSVMEALSRVKAVLRRAAPTKMKEINVGCISLNIAGRSVRTPEGEAALTYKEFELLCFLMLNAGLVLSRDKILTELWGYDYDGESRTVDMHVKTLRQKLGNAGKLIKTIRHIGYKIEAEV
jgi:two-component system alkaline phosphatase synthesis response regulator PhoP